jgi:hypothetical protein
MARSLVERLEGVGRRSIFVAMGLALTVPLLFPLGLPSRAASPVMAIYHAIEDLPEGSTVFVSVDLDPASMPELRPFLHAVLGHLKKRRHRVVLVSLWVQAPPLVERWIKETLDRPAFPGDRAYIANQDYVWLGFREGRQAIIASLGQDLAATFAGRAADGTPLTEIPMMRRLDRLSDFALLVLLSAGSPGARDYVQLVQARYGLRMVAAATASTTTDLTPYYQAGQLLGLAGGIAAVAQYEVLVARLVGIDPKAGLAARSVDVLNVGHLVVIAAIVLGNILFFARRRGAR